MGDEMSLQAPSARSPMRVVATAGLGIILVCGVAVGYVRSRESRRFTVLAEKEGTRIPNLVGDGDTISLASTIESALKKMDEVRHEVVTTKSSSDLLRMAILDQVSEKKKTADNVQSADQKWKNETHAELAEDKVTDAHTKQIRHTVAPVGSCPVPPRCCIFTSGSRTSL